LIVSHRHKYIFIKTRKTAGTSLELALCQYADEEDIITPVTTKDEGLRQELQVRGPQNYRIPTSALSRMEKLSSLVHRKKPEFFNHYSARALRDRLSPEVWDTYFKFTIERNPFDKAISRYYFRGNDKRYDMPAFFQNCPVHLISNWEHYAINDVPAVDHVIRFENLAREVEQLAERLELPGPLDMPRAKGKHRSDRRHYSQVLDEVSRKRIELVCAKEIAYFGYHWEDQP
jgi:hypothetical protein